MATEVEHDLLVQGFLVVRADGVLRTVKQNPRLRLDEVAFPLSVRIPHQWGQVQPQRIEVELPDPPEARVTVGKPELEDDEGG